MPLSTGIKTQRSAVVLLNGVTFEHNPNNTDERQQVKEGGIAIEATDSSTIYIKEEIVFNLNADKWFRAANNSNITWLADFDIIVSNQASDSSVIPFDLYRNSTIDLKAGEDFGRFNNNSTLTLTQLLSGTKIDTSSSLYINDDLETEVKKDTTDIKGSLNNIFYSVAPVDNYLYNSLERGLSSSNIENSSNSIICGTWTSGDKVRNTENSIIIGNAAVVDNNLASTGFTQNSDVLIFGHEVRSFSNTKSIFIGNNIDVGSGANIVIGHNASGGANNSIAIGNNSDASAGLSISIGFETKNKNVSGGNNPSSLNSISMGVRCNNYSNGSSNRNYNISLGYESETNHTNKSTSIGYKAITTADSAIQLGEGTNNNVNTLQFLSNTIANSQGIQAPVTTGANPQSPPSGTIYVDDTSGSERICVYLNGGWKCADLT